MISTYPLETQSALVVALSGGRSEIPDWSRLLGVLGGANPCKEGDTAMRAKLLVVIQREILR